uniref:FAD-dependent oxidoreductase n=1 Tax=Neomoorella sulfitireducens TaxID=2972948 RepID=UPI0021AD3355
MSSDKYDVIVVGAGPAGLAASYKLAQAGLEVVLIERGDYPGSKNLSGGVLYSRVLEKLIPAFWEEAPVERYITNYLTTFMTRDDAFTLDFKTGSFAKPPYNAFTVLRAKFDRWLAEKAEEAAVALVTGIRVDSVLKEGDRVVGIRAGEEEMLSDVVIAADGVNSFLAEQAGLRKPIKLEHLAVGVKELIELPREVIEERFNLRGDEGAAYALVGEATHGIAGGAFLYTNKESISLGVVMRLDDLVKSGQQPSEIIEDLMEHPCIAPLIKDGRTIEYGAHLIAEGGMEMMPQLYTGGMLVAGDAAGF